MALPWHSCRHMSPPPTQDCLRARQWSWPHRPGHLQDVPSQSICLQRLSQSCPRAAPRECPSQPTLIGARLHHPCGAPRTRHPPFRQPQGDSGPAGLGHCDNPSARCLPTRRGHRSRYHLARATGASSVPAAPPSSQLRGRDSGHLKGQRRVMMRLPEGSSWASR